MSTTNRNTLKQNKLRINTISAVTALYFSFITYASIWDTLRVIHVLPILFLIFYYMLESLVPSVLNSAGYLCTQYSNISKNKRFFIFLSIILLGQVVYWLGYYPGGFNLDAYGQWDQVHGVIPLNNWHPVLTTALYWVITRFYDSFPFCILVQLGCFSISVAYLLTVLSDLKIPIFLLAATALYIAVNPAIGMNNISLIKDVPFCIAIIWITVVLIRIVESKGAWLNSNGHLLCLIAVLLAISLIRHNGLFIILPVVLCIAFIFQKYIKRILAVTAAYFFLFGIIQDPVFSLFQVEQHSNFTGEVVGIPMAIMANNLVNDYDSTPDDVKVFLLSIAALDEWEENYILGEWDSCKWDFGGTELFQNETLAKILDLTWQSVSNSPETAYRSFRENTKVVWKIVGYSEWNTLVYIEDNEYEIIEAPNNYCRTIVDTINNLSLGIPGTTIFWNIGVANLIFIFLTWYVVVRREYEKMVYLIPPLIYNLLTMMLLCGPSHRYFYFNSVLVLPIVLLVLRQSSNT